MRFGEWAEASLRRPVGGRRFWSERSQFQSVPVPLHERRWTQEQFRRLDTLEKFYDRTRNTGWWKRHGP